MTKWDNLDNSNVWRNETKFKADKWEGSVSQVKFCAVQWDAQYEHIVDWETDEKRDRYFTDLEGYIVSENTEWNFKSLEVFKPNLGRHVGSIRIDIPYEEIMNFNYISIIMDEQPVPGSGIPRREHYYYFLTSLNKIAPSTSEIFVELDSWTTFGNSVEFNSVKVNRGHYTHALTPADKFLKNPLENTYGITDLEPELPSLKPLVSSEKLVSFSKSSPRVCIATTVDFSANTAELWEDITDIKNIKDVSSSSTPSSEWWKKQIGEGNLGNNGLAPVSAVGKNNVNQPFNVYSLNPTDFSNFISTCRKRYPQILKTIKAVYVLDSALISESSAISFIGYSFKQVLQQNDFSLIEKIELSKSLFNYKDVYKDFAKLYTAQFALLEISNLQGEKIEVAVEDIAEDLEIYARSSAAFPFLKLEAFINGVGGNKKTSYSVKPLGSMNSSLFSSQWEDFKFDIDVPVYGVFAEEAEISGPELNADAFKNINKNRTDFENDNKNILTTNTRNLKDINRDYSNDVDSYTRNYNVSIKDVNRDYSNQAELINTRFSNNIKDINRDYSNDVDSYTRNYNVSIKDIDRNYFNSALEYNNVFNNSITDVNRNYENSVNNVNIMKAENTIYSNDLTFSKDSKIMAYQAELKGISEERNSWTDEEPASRGYYRINEIYMDEMSQAYNYMTKQKKRSIYRSYNSSKAYNKFMAYSHIKTALEQAELNVAVNGFSSLINIGTSMAAGNGIGAISSAASYAINEAAAEDNYSINGETLVREYNATNSGDIGWTVGMLGWDIEAVDTADWTWERVGKDNYAYDFMPEQSVTIGPSTYTYKGVGFSAIPALQAIYEAEMNYSFYNSSLYEDFSKKYKEGVENARIQSASPSFASSETIELFNVYYPKQVSERDEIVSETETINNLNKTTDSDIADSIKNTSEAISEKNINVDKSIADVSKSTDSGIAERNKTVSTEIRTNEKNTDSSVNSRNKTVGTSIADVSKLTDSGIAERNKIVSTEINKLERETETAINTRTYENNLKNFSADVLKSFYSEPKMFSENSGSAWVDAWGLRGIDIRVRRCSEGSEKIAGDMFFMYGYNSPGVWAEEIKLSLMEKFTYWKVGEVWLNGERINETNKEIIRNIFKNGVFVWRKPQEIMNVDIHTNTIRSKK